MLAALLLAAQALALDAHVGVGPAYDMPSASWQVRGGIGARLARFRLDAIYERSFRVLESSGQEGCVEEFARGGCLAMPHLLGGRFTFFPVTWGPIEPIVFVTAGWANRAVKGHTETRDDLALGGGLGADLDVRPFYGSLWLRALRYVTYDTPSWQNRWTIGAGLDVGVRF